MAKLRLKCTKCYCVLSAAGAGNTDASPVNIVFTI